MMQRECYAMSTHASVQPVLPAFFDSLSSFLRSFFSFIALLASLRAALCTVVFHKTHEHTHIKLATALHFLLLHRHGTQTPATRIKIPLHNDTLNLGHNTMIATHQFIFFFKQKTAYELHCVTGVQTCALPI